MGGREAAEGRFLGGGGNGGGGYLKHFEQRYGEIGC